MPRALAVCGGGSRGLIQLGMLEYLVDHKITYDCVFAGSVGALNALLMLQGQMSELHDLWLNIRNKDVYVPRILSLWKLLTNDASLYDQKPLEGTIRKYLDIDKIRNLPIPFIVAVTNLTTMQPELKDIRTLDHESAVQWILASASPPILFKTITISNNENTDCGIIDNYFLSDAINAGYDEIICLTPTTVKPKPIRNLLDIIQATISTSSYGYLDRERHAIEKVNKIIDQANIELTDDIKRISLYVVKPDVPVDLGLIDFEYKGYNRKALIQLGYDLAAAKLKDIIL